jgi:hypothetical protein
MFLKTAEQNGPPNTAWVWHEVNKDKSNIYLTGMGAILRKIGHFKGLLFEPQPFLYKIAQWLSSKPTSVGLSIMQKYTDMKACRIINA